MVSIKEEYDLTIKEEPDGRKDPTMFLPEEPMSYEIKPKKKKRKKKQEDPFKDVEEKTNILDTIDPCLDVKLDPEVSIKVENIEVELDFNDFANNAGLMVEGPHSEDSQEQAVKIEEQNREAVILTFQSIINSDHSVFGNTTNATPLKHANTCKICHLVFHSPRTLITHQKRKHKIFRRSFKHICDYCGMSYEVKNSLIAHIKRKHTSVASPDSNEEKTCEVCSLVFKGDARLRMHMRRKHGSFEDSFKYACPDCDLTYDKGSSLIVHIKRKHRISKTPVSDQWFNCPFCPKIFNRRETYGRHIQRKHQSPENGADHTDGTSNYLENRNQDTGEISCTECPLVFSSINFLKLHMRRKHNALQENFRYKCRVCNLSYDKIESLKRHVRRKHDNEFQCDECNKKFPTKESWLKHSHIKVIKECTICGLIFSSQGGLAKHMRCTHKKDGPKVVFCHLCKEGFSENRQLKHHLLKVHLKATYTCVYCNKIFKAKESYRRHILIQHPPQVRGANEMQQCTQCTKSFPDEMELCRHINFKHKKASNVDKEAEVVLDDMKEEEIVNSFQCTKCPDLYSTWDELKTHFTLNHQELREAQCQICGEIIRETELQNHIKNMHKMIQQCDYCEFKTKSKTSMTQHMLRHKNATTLHCEFPGCRYKSYYELAMQKHKQKHKELGVKLQCTKCPFQSMNKYILKYHEEAHVTGKKKYTCDQCNYATILPANLVQHKYKHSTEKRFKCEVCPFATKYNTSLRFHVKNKHCDLPSFS
ncbi:hypothetical protein ACJJTC_000269 [Scirpophaga incertulas]